MLDEATPKTVLQSAQSDLAKGAAGAALRALDEGLARFPDHPGMAGLRFNALRRLGRGADALAYAETLAKSQWSAPMFQAKSQALLDMGEGEAADALLAAAPVAIKQTALWGHSRAGCLEKLRGGDAALQWLRIFRASAVDAWFLAAYEAQVLARLGRLEESNSVLAEAMNREFQAPFLFQLARNHQAMGQLETALEVLEANREKVETDPHYFVTLSRVKAASGDLVGALSAAETGLDHAPELPALIAARYDGLRVLGRMGEAQAMAEGLERCRWVPAMYEASARNLLAVGRAGDARDLLLSAPSDLQSTPPWIKSMVACIEAISGGDAALKWLTTAGTRADTAWIPATEKARVLLGLGRIEEAHECLKSVISQGSSIYPVFQLARSLMTIGNAREALEILLENEAAAKVHPAFYAISSEALAQAGDRAEALSQAETGARKFPRDVSVRAALWRAMARDGRRGDAVRDCRAFAEGQKAHAASLVAAMHFLNGVEDDENCDLVIAALNNQTPVNVEAVIGQARVLLARSDASAALSRLNSGMKDQDWTAAATLLAANIETALGDAAATCKRLKSLLKREPHNTDGHFEMARQMVASGDWAMAQQHLSRMGEGTGARAARVDLLRAQMAAETDGPPAAIAFARRATQQDPRGPAGWDLKARFEYLLGDVTAAWESCARAEALKAATNLTGRKSAKPSQSFLGHILNEFRLLGPDAGFEHCRAEAPQQDAASYFRARLDETPGSFPCAVLLLSALQRMGRISSTPPQTGEGEAAIPKTVHQFWDTAEIPAQVAALMAHNRALNPDYAFHVHDLAKARRFLKDRDETEALRAFELAPLAAAKADIFRLAVLWHEGGVYMDADDRCIGSLNDIVDRHLSLIAYQEEYRSVGNNFLAVAPKHPVIRDALDDAAAAFRGSIGETLWLSTGPGAITRAVAAYGTECDGSLSSGIWIMPRHRLSRSIAAHVTLSYKGTASHWLRHSGKMVN